MGEALYDLGNTFRSRVSHVRRDNSTHPNNGLTKNRSSEFWALRDVTFDVSEGEVVGIVGCNGAGKSTLLKLLSRISEPTEGRFGVRGRVGSLLEVGTGFHPELTGRENIFLSGSILGMSRNEIRQHFDQIVDFAEVDSFLDTPVKRYSSGMSVRLGFAVAAHVNPEVLIVDEVLAVGDLQFQRKCLGRIHEIAASGRTVLFVSHNMETISRLCSRAILLQNGRLTVDGPPAEVIEEYSANSLPQTSTGLPGADQVKSVAMHETAQPAGSEFEAGSSAA